MNIKKIKYDLLLDILNRRPILFQGNIPIGYKKLEEVEIKLIYKPSNQPVQPTENHGG